MSNEVYTVFQDNVTFYLRLIHFSIYRRINFISDVVDINGARNYFRNNIYWNKKMKRWIISIYSRIMR